VAETESRTGSALKPGHPGIAVAVRSSGIGGHDTMSGEVRPCCWPVPLKCNPISYLRAIEIRALC
jgi:hypothetical protein